MKDFLLSVIVPLYNEQEVLPYSHPRFVEALKGFNYELIYVDDGSDDDTLNILKKLCGGRVKALSFSRNFGHQLAVTAGMDEAKGDALVIIDADLQDPPELIGEMVHLYEKGADIVYGKRKKREGESLFKRFSAWAYYRLLSFMSAYPIPLDSGDFRLISRAVADNFSRMREHNRFLRGMSAWMGYKAVPLEYVRAGREAGKTKYTLKKMLKFAFDGITGFSIKPLTIPLYLGFALFALSFILFVVLCVSAFFKRVEPILFMLCFMAFIQSFTLMALGVMGGYMGRMYDELKGRPLYIIKEKL